MKRTHPITSSASSSSRTEAENAQWLRVMSRPRQPSRRKAPATPARQAIAWLSPISATVRVASSSGVPNAQMNSAPSMRLLESPTVPLPVHG